MSTEALRKHLGDRISKRLRDKVYSGGLYDIPDRTPEDALNSVDVRQPQHVEVMVDDPIEWDSSEGDPVQWDEAPEQDQSLGNEGFISSAINKGKDAFGSAMDSMAEDRARNRQELEGVTGKELYNKLQSGTSLSDAPLAALDYVTAETSGMFTTIAGGLAGLGVMPFKGTKEAKDTIQQIQSYAYQPRTKLGKKAIDLTDKAFQFWSDINRDKNLDVEAKVRNAVDGMIERGELPESKRQQAVDSMYSPVKRAIGQGMHDLIPAAFGRKAASDRSSAPGLDALPAPAEGLPAPVEALPQLREGLPAPENNALPAPEQKALPTRRMAETKQPSVIEAPYRPEGTSMVGGRPEVINAPHKPQLPAQINLPDGRQPKAVETVPDAVGESPILAPKDDESEANIFSPENMNKTPEPNKNPSIDRELARRAHMGTSFSPEKRADMHVAEFDNILTSVREDLSKISKNDEQKKILDSSMDRFSRGLKSKYERWLEAKSRVMSPMITGPANFPTARNEKANNVEAKRLNELIDYQKKAEARIRRDIVKGRSPEDAHPELKRNIRSSLETIKEIDSGMKGTSRPLIASSIQNKVLAAARRGDVEQVDMAMKSIEDYNANNKKPAFTPRNKIWQAPEIARMKRAEKETPGESVEKQYKGLTYRENKADDRVELEFDGKPDPETRAKLKKKAFKWSPSKGVWQRKLTNNAKHEAESFVSENGYSKADDAGAKKKTEEPEAVEPEKKGAKGGLGGKQGGEFNPGVLIDGYDAIVKSAKEAAKGAADFGYDVGRHVTFGPVEVIRDLGTPSSHRLADLISRPRTNKSNKPVSPDFFEREQSVGGKFATKIDGILEPLRGRIGSVTKENNDLIMKMLEGNKVEAPKSVTKAAREIRKMLNDLQKYAEGQGVEIGYLENYVPRVWDTIKIQKDIAGFKKFLAGKGVDPDRADSIAHNILTNEGRYDQEFGYSPHPKSSKPTMKHFKKRSLDKITNQDAKDWIVYELEPLISVYARNMANRVEYAREFGANGEKFDSLVKDIIKESKANTDKRVSSDQIQDIAFGLSEAMLNRYGHIKTPSIQRLSRVASSLQVMSKLGTVTATSLVEFGLAAGMSPTGFAKGILQAGAGSAVEGLASMSRLITGKRRLDKTEFRQNAEDLGHVAVQTLNSAVASRFAGKTGNMTAKFMRLVLHEQMANLQRSATYGIANSIVRRNARYLSKKGANKRLSKDYSRQLVEMGLDPKEAVKWWEDGAKPGEFQSKADIGSISFVNRIIQKPNPATSPLWMFDEHLAWLSIFKKYTASFANNYITKMFSELKDSKSFRGKMTYPLGSVFAMVVSYHAVMAVKDLLKYGGSENNPYHQDNETKKLVEAADRAGLTGWMTYGVALFSPRYGFWDGGAQRLLNVLGPNATDAAKLIEIGFAEDKAKKTARFVSQNLPIANVYRPLRKEVSEGVEKALGGNPGKRSSKGRRRKRSR